MDETADSLRTVADVKDIHSLQVPDWMFTHTSIKKKCDPPSTPVETGVSQLLPLSAKLTPPTPVVSRVQCLSSSIDVGHNVDMSSNNEPGKITVHALLFRADAG